MRWAWRAFTTVFTVLGVAAIVGGAVMLKAGRISIDARPEPEAEQSSRSTESTGAGAPSPAVPPRKLSEPEARLWLQRLEKLRAELAETDRDLAARSAALKKEREALHPLAEALSALLGVLAPEKPLTPDELLSRPDMVAKVAETIRGKTARMDRLPELLTTLQEMTEDEAATLFSSPSISNDLAMSLLRSMDAETRASEPRGEQGERKKEKEGDG
jgi:hypothetical protein